MFGKIGKTSRANLPVMGKIQKARKSRSKLWIGRGIQELG
jgi:hypothetical protein